MHLCVRVGWNAADGSFEDTIGWWVFLAQAVKQTLMIKPNTPPTLLLFPKVLLLMVEDVIMIADINLLDCSS